MTRSTSWFVALALVGTISGTASVSSAQQYVIPPANTAVEGAQSTSFVLAGADKTIQMLFSNALLGGVASGGITSISFRLDNAELSNFFSSVLTYTDYDIRVSNFAGPLTSNLTTNEAGSTLVRSGPLVIAANAYTSGSSPNSFGPEILFSTPFSYFGGDLFVSIRHNGNDQAVSASVDAAIVGAGEASFVFADGYAATTGIVVNDIAVVARIQVVPEPSTIALMGVGFFGLAGVARRRRLC